MHLWLVDQACLKTQLVCQLMKKLAAHQVALVSQLTDFAVQLDDSDPGSVVMPAESLQTRSGESV